jgi:hypothetical protein
MAKIMTVGVGTSNAIRISIILDEDVGIVHLTRTRHRDKPPVLLPLLLSLPGICKTAAPHEEGS